MLFKKEFLLDEMCGGDETETVLEETVDVRRWVKQIRRIFTFQGKLYETFYEVGLTEEQDISPYEYDDDEIECKEVFAKEKITLVYE